MAFVNSTAMLLLAAAAACGSGGSDLADARIVGGIDAHGGTVDALPDGAVVGAHDASPNVLDAPQSPLDAPVVSPDAIVDATVDANVPQPDAVPSPFVAGDGTIASPYQIATIEQFIDVNNVMYSANAFQLTADLDLTGVDVAPIGFQNDSPSFTFYGVFDGNHHQISNWSYASYSTCVGLFGTVGGTVHDVTLVNPTVNSTAQVGGIVGCLQGGLLVRDHVIGGTISASSFGAGGIASEMLTGGPFTGIEACSSSADVRGLQAGGLVSQLNSGQIIDSFSQGSVGGASGSSHGGLLATLGPASLVRTYSSAAVAQTSSAGALVGFDEGVPPTIVVDSFWDVSDSGLPTSADGTELTSTEMFQQSSFTNWDFTNVWQLNTGKEPTLRADADAAPLVATQSLNFPAGVTPNPITLSGFDFDGDSFTFSIVDAPSQGSLSAIVGDQLTYTPNANGANNDTFTFVATDVHGVASPLGVITINAPAVSP